MNGVIIVKRNTLSEADSQSILDLFKNFIGSLSDEATLYVTDESCNKQYIIISDWMQSYCIQWIGNDYKFVGQDMLYCKHTTVSNGVKVTKEKAGREKDTYDIKEIDRIGYDVNRYERVKSSINNMKSTLDDRN